VTQPSRSAIASTSLPAALLLLACAGLAPACIAPGDGDDRDATGTRGSAVTVPAALGLDAPDGEFLATPTGRIHRSCVHVVDSGAEIDASGRVTSAAGESSQLAPCRYAVRDRIMPGPAAVTAPPGAHANSVAENASWIETVSAQIPTNGFGFNWTNSVRGNWLVPPRPRQFASQTVFLLIGAAPQNNSALLETVLQYGASAAGGGNFWSTFLAYSSDNTGNVVLTNARRVNVGDVIQGLVDGLNCSSDGHCTWRLIVNINADPSSPTFSVSPPEVFQKVYEGVLAAVNLHNCNQLPVEGETGASFTNVHITMPGPTPFDYTDVKNSLGWLGTVNGSGCSYGMINNFDGVDLFWN
jgi:hypothetical protein